MHALGNDFMVIDGVRQQFQPNPQLIAVWANRHTGIGFDQLLLIEKANNPDADFIYRIFNADGSEVAQCGNGARCIAKFLHDEKLTTKNPIRVETLAGILELKLENDDQVTVDIGTPIFEPEKIPFIAEKPAIKYTLDNTEICALSVGNPHCVLVVKNVDAAPVQELGSVLTKHQRFPQQTNVGFMEIVNHHHIRLRVYERGVGETLACGSGACAAVVAGRLLNLLDTKVTVELPGGHLTVTWQGEKSSVFLTGPAVTVFRGYVAPRVERFLFGS